MTQTLVDPSTSQTPPQILVAFNRLSELLRGAFGAESWDLAPETIMAEVDTVAVEVHVDQSRYDAAVDTCASIAMTIRREFGVSFALLVIANKMAAEEEPDWLRSGEF
jgi:hypothetical protein